MTKEQCNEINGLTNAQKQVIYRWFWAAEKKGVPCKLEACQTEEEVLEMVNKSFRNKPETTQVSKQSIKLEEMSVDELNELLERIPAILEQKKAEQLAEIEAQIKQLQEMKKQLS